MNLLNKIFKKDDNFGIIISQDKEFDIEGVQHHKQILRLNIDNLIKPKPLLTQADPFMFVKDNCLFLFYESQRAGEKGIIRMMKTNNMHDWTKPVTVLKEPFHLSFPFVFEFNGSAFMIPESQEADSIFLYKGNHDLTSFSLERVLMTKPRTDKIMFNFCDSHVIYIDGYFYLFTSVAYDWTYHLELYYTDDILHNDFVKHPCSPIYIGNDYGRSGGSIIHLNDNYYRISQKCDQSYGENISVHRITLLNKEEYKEELFIKNILTSGRSPYNSGGHQLNIVKFGNSYIYSTDFRKVSWSWYQLYLRLKKGLRAIK